MNRLNVYIIFPLWILVLAYVSFAIFGVYVGIEIINSIIENVWVFVSGFFLLLLFIILLLKRTSKGSSAFIKSLGCLSLFGGWIIYLILAMKLNWDYNANIVSTHISMITFGIFILYLLLICLNDAIDSFSIIGVIVSIGVVVGGIIWARTFYVAQDIERAKEQIISYRYVVSAESADVYYSTKIYMEGNNSYPSGAFKREDDVMETCHKGDKLKKVNKGLQAFSAKGYILVELEDGRNGFISEDYVMEQGAETRYDVEYAK